MTEEDTLIPNLPECPEGMTEEEVINNLRDLTDFFKELEKIPEVVALMKKYRIGFGKRAESDEERMEFIKNYSLYIENWFD